MNFLSLDLEMNQPSGKVIEVGIAIGNIDHGIIAIKNWFVNPEEPIEEYITQLTGIDDDAIREASVPMETVASELSDLIQQHDCFVNPVQWGGGDSQKLLSEFRIKEIPFQHFGRREIDVKTICVFLAMAEGKKTAGGLKSFVRKHGLSFRGTAHRAAVDAENTLSLFLHLLKRQGGIESFLSQHR
ncbi:MAG: exonuclease domain-containing protein [Candidatus Nanopelagicaceae bacterium]